MTQHVQRAALSKNASSPKADLAPNVQKKSALRGKDLAEQTQMLSPDAQAPVQAKGLGARLRGAARSVGGAIGDAAHAVGDAARTAGGAIGDAAHAAGDALLHPKDTIYDARLGMKDRQKDVRGQGHDIPNQDIIMEQLAHSGAYGKLDPTKLAAWGYREAGACNDPESGFRAVLYVPTAEALAGQTEQAQVIQATHGGTPPPVLAMRGTAEARGWSDDTNREGIGTYQFSSNETRIEGMLGAACDKCIVTGHSLGGELAQLTATHFPGQVKRVVTFQSPGINAAEADKLKQHNAGAAPEDQITSTHHRAEGDVVHAAGEALTDGDVYTHRSVGIGNPKDHCAYPLARLSAARGDIIPGVNDTLGDKGGDRLVKIDKTTTDRAKGDTANKLAEGGRKRFGGVLRDESMEVYTAFWRQVKEMIATGIFPREYILATIRDTDKLTPDQKIKMRDQAQKLIPVAPPQAQGDAA